MGEGVGEPPPGIAPTFRPLRGACYHVHALGYSHSGDPMRTMRGLTVQESEYWLDQQAIERLAQHIPFETDPRTKSELIEMLRGIVLRAGRNIDRESFGFEAAESLKRLGLWGRLGGVDR